MGVNISQSKYAAKAPSVTVLMFSKNAVTDYLSYNA